VGNRDPVGHPEVDSTQRNLPVHPKRGEVLRGLIAMGCTYAAPRLRDGEKTACEDRRPVGRA
jgi:hypothetical protein